MVTTQDSVLIETVVYLASKAREATGQDPIADLPKGTHSSGSCPLAKALNLNCSVHATWIYFHSHASAVLVAEALGLDKPTGAQVTIPPGHPFQQFVSRFDEGHSKQLNQFVRGT